MTQPDHSKAIDPHESESNRAGEMSGGSQVLDVCIVEDDARVRETLRHFINETKNFSCTKTFRDGESALAELPDLKPDIVLMDIRLPGMSGIKCTRALKARLPNLPIIMLTAFDEDDFLFDSLKAGANGYLLKRTPGSKLLESLREACFGGLPLTPYIAAKVSEYFQNLARAETDFEGLTPREHETLQLLADGLRYKEIAHHMGIALDTVRKHVRSIYIKLHVSSRTEAVVKYLRR
jgi:DNA-binding NarL/FixJ family response regulator